MNARIREYFIPVSEIEITSEVVYLWFSAIQPKRDIFPDWISTYGLVQYNLSV